MSGPFVHATAHTQPHNALSLPDTFYGTWRGLGLLRFRHDVWGELYGRWVQPVLSPPSTGRIAPVMYAAPGEQR